MAMTSDLITIPYIFDLETTNLCNTDCVFCPREAIVRPKGRMSAETFAVFLHRLRDYANRIEGQMVRLEHEKASVRAGKGVESPVRVLMCGMGECLTHPHAPEWIARIRSEVGVRASVVTNGALLDETMTRRLVSANVTVVIVSVPGVSRNTYGRFMKLDWDRVLANVLRAADLLPGRVEVSVTIPRDAGFTPADVLAFWRPSGVRISAIIPCHSRGGFMSDPRLLSASAPPLTRACGVFARHNFVAWDGRVLSCCHDLRGENVMGDLQHHDLVQMARRKAPILERGLDFAICPRCDDSQRADPAAVAKVSLQSLG